MGSPHWGRQMQVGRLEVVIFYQYVAIPQQEAPLSPREPHDPQLKYWPTVVHITQTDRVSPPATFYFATCIVFTGIFALGTTIARRAGSAVCVINRLSYNQSCWCQLDRNCDNQCRLPSVLLMTPHITPPVHHHGLDVNHCGEWTQRFQTPKVTFKVTKGHSQCCHW